VGQRSGRVHAATWAEAGLLTAARLTDSRTTAYEPAAELVEQSLSWLEEAGLAWHPQARPRVRADIGYCGKAVAAQIVAAGADFAIGVQRQPKIWWLLGQIHEQAWFPALGLDRAEITVTDYPYRGWPTGTRLVIRRVRHDAEAISADPRARRRRTLLPNQLALALEGPADGVYGYSFILTNLPTATPEQAAALEHWHRHRTDIEECFKQAKHGAALRHLPSGDPRINRAWVHAAFLATALTAWLNLLLGGDARTGLIRWRRELLHTPGRLVRHAGRIVLRCPPGALLPAVLARIRALPAAS
jgi:YD repeat-containing protein